MFKKVSVICLVGLLSACGGGSSSTSNVEAPDSLQGKLITHTIQNGSGLFATQGEYLVKISSTGNTYVLTGDGTNVANSAGIYTYSKNANIGTVDLIDSVISSGATCKYTFSTVSSGSFSCTAINSNSNGSFKIL